MGIPILKLGRCLLVSIQGDVSDTELMELSRNLAEEIGSSRSRGVVLDVSGMELLDSFSARMLHEIANIGRFRGAETVIAGIRPNVAFAMTQLGLTLTDVTKVMDLEEGLSFLEKNVIGGRRTYGQSNEI